MDDQILLPPDDTEIAILVNRAQVAGTEPAGDGGGVQIKEDSQRDHLTPPARQAPHRRQQGGIEAIVEAGSRQPFLRHISG